LKKLVYLVSGGISTIQEPDPTLLVEQAYRYALETLDMNMDTAVPLMDGTVVSFVPPVPDTGDRVMEHIGLSSVPRTHVQNSEAAGGMCFQEAFRQIESNEMDIVLACGWKITTETSQCQDPAKSLYHEMPGITPDHLTKIAAKNLRHGAHNPYARRYDPSHGAAVCILASDTGLRRIQKRGRLRHPIIVSSTGQAHDSNPEMRRALTCHAIAQAYRQATIRISRSFYELDFIELHDDNPVSEIEGYEDFGLCPKGEAAAFIDGGFPFLKDMDYGSKLRPYRKLRNIPVNPSGGLTACGYSGAATNLRQTVFSLWQMQQTIGRHFGSHALQVPNPRRCAIHAVNDTGDTITVSILER